MIAAPVDDAEQFVAPRRSPAVTACDLYVNGQSVGQASLPYTTSFQRTTAGSYEFGYNEITRENGLGYFDIDAMVVE